MCGNKVIYKEWNTSPVVATKPVIPILMGKRTSDVPLKSILIMQVKLCLTTKSDTIGNNDV